MAVSGKTSKISSIVATLCIMIYVVAVVFGVVRVIVDIGDRRNLAYREFEALVDRSSAFAEHFGFFSPAHQEGIREFVASSHTLLGVIVSGSGGDFAVERSPGNSIVWAGNTPRFRTGLGLPAQPLFLPLTVEGHTNVSIQALYSTINNPFLVRVLRDTLLAVLVALAIAFIMLIVELTQRDRSYYQAASGETTAHAKTKGAPPAIGDEEDDPHGLFTSRGNIGWESYTHDRLSSELHRCASFEQDLVYMVMEFKCDEKIEDPVYLLFADEAVIYFTMRDLIFEMGEKGLSVIIPSVDLEQAMARAEDFRVRVANRLPEHFESREKLYIGLSSRSGRLIEAGRLMMEASTALEKTQEEPVSHIVAFKSDPEKYRKFIKRRS
ncbi:MAG: hypothetical protein FWB99_12225 [Treponema sp.]|nr:hypothetical protein [Treponema sp.]